VYTLRLPFQIGEDRKLTELDEALESEVEGLRLRLENMSQHSVLTVEGFKSAEDAEAFLLRSMGGLYWAMLSQSLPFTANEELREVHHPEDPRRAAENYFGPGTDFAIEGMLDGSRPAVYPSGLKIVVTTAGVLNAEVGISAPQLLSSIQEGMLRTDVSALKDDRVRIALELFRSHFFERSSEARLITLVMALESLAPPEDKHPIALELIDAWKIQLTERQSALAEESEEYDGLDALHGLLSQTKASITSQIRVLVRDTLGRAGFPDAEQRARRWVDVYKTRNKLAHNGRVDAAELHGALRDAKALAIDVLRIRLAADVVRD
jgi:hypothetical protein